MLVPQNATLAKLHAILCGAMGWQGDHLHEYVVGRLRYGIPDIDWPGIEPVVNERRVRLKTLVEAGTRGFTYLYDFGDFWEHSIVIEDLAPPATDDALIRCIAGENACPPEDVGGPAGYSEFLAALNDAKHREHAHVLRWVGRSFDHAAFDVAEVNERLAAIKA